MSTRPPVLVLPGFGASDLSTLAIRRGLAFLGYRVHGWRLGRNEGANAEVRAAMTARLDDLVGRYEDPVAIVGWSLGGIYAWELARRFPDKVQQVVTLGSPLRPLATTATPASTPLTSIWSRNDRIVRWQSSVIETAPFRENIEVRATHATLGFDPLVLAAVADRLAQRPESWKPFTTPPWLAGAYPGRSAG